MTDTTEALPEAVYRAFLSHCRARRDGSRFMCHEAHCAMREAFGKDGLQRVGLIDGIGFPLWHEPYEHRDPFCSRP